MARVLHLIDLPGGQWKLLVQVFCGMLSRIAQFTDILKDSRLQLQKVQAHLDESSKFTAMPQQP